jgi:hypothetical protein
MINFARKRASVPRRVDPDGEKATERLQIVATPSWVREVERWAKSQEGRAKSISEAIRYLVTRGIRADEDDRRG